MVKKLCIAVGAVIVGLVVVAVCPRLKSGVEDAYKSVCTWKDNVPPEKQLSQLHGEIDKIDGDIKKNLKKLAAQEVEADKLEANLKTLKGDQVKLKAEIVKMDEALDSKEKFVSYNDTKYRPSELALKLESATNTYEIKKNQVKTMEQLVASKRQSLELSHQRITEMKEQKEKLRVIAAKLEARIEAVKLKQVDSPIDMDNSQVSKCIKLAEELDTKLAKEEKEADLNIRYGYDNKKTFVVPAGKSVDEVRQNAKKALLDSEEEKVEDSGK